MKIHLKARPHSLEIDSRFAAIVVVDMQNAFVRKGGVFDLAGLDVSHGEQLIRTIRPILERARQKNIKIVYLQMGYNEDLSDSGGPGSPNWHKELALVLMRESAGSQKSLLTRGTWDFAIVEELKPDPEDLVIVKSRYSGFAATPLDSLLRERQIRYLFFAGVATNVCVESTLRHAYFLDYWPILIRDAVMQAGPDYLQQATVHNVENHFGWTVTAEDFLSGLERI